MTLVALGLGSNREPRLHLEAGLRALEARYGELKLSGVFESEPVGFRGPDFLNLVVTLETPETLEGMLHFLKQLDDCHGRLRETPRVSDRNMEIDILIVGSPCGRYAGGRLYGDVTLTGPEGSVKASVHRPLAQLLGARLHPLPAKTYI